MSEKITMEESSIIQRLKQRIAEKKRGEDEKQQEEEPEAEQIDFKKFMKEAKQ